MFDDIVTLKYYPDTIYRLPGLLLQMAIYRGQTNSIQIFFGDNYQIFEYFSVRMYEIIIINLSSCCDIYNGIKMKLT